jgi:hypothetical protein
VNVSRAQAANSGGAARGRGAPPAGPDASQTGDAEAGQPGSAADAPPGTPPATAAGQRATAAVADRLRTPAARRAAGHLLLLVSYVAAGIGVTWPTTANLAGGKLPVVPDVSSYIWALWWMAHQVSHLGDPWFTHFMAAPVGIELGFDTLMPLPGLIMTPITLLGGPAASFSVLTVAIPGLLCYVTYRAARLWLGQPGAIAAGAFFGLSTMATWQNLFHLNIAIGTLFLPLTLEAAVRLKRRPARRQGIILGLVLGASVLTNQESAVVAALLAVAILLPWLIRLFLRPPRFAGAIPPLRTLALGAVVAVIVASPQLIPMFGQVTDGGAAVAADQSYQLTQSYQNYGVGLPTLFAPSPRLGFFHLGQLASAYQFAEPTEGVPTFGVILAGLAVIGLLLSWRRRQMWLIGLLWLAGAALALGPTLTIGTRTYVPLAEQWHGVTVSLLMPYTWLIRIPGLSALREADRLALLGLLGAAILAGAAVQWLCDHAWRVVAGAVIVVIAAAGFLEAGWASRGATMPTLMPSVDGPIAAYKTNSIVVDVPFGLRGGVGVTGFKMPPEALLLATADGHPRAVSYTSWVPQPTISAIARIPFYRLLYKAQDGARYPHNGPEMIAARHSAIHEKIGWIIVWRTQTEGVRKSAVKFLFSAGFHIAYHVNTPEGSITVWRRSK